MYQMYKNNLPLVSIHLLNHFLHSFLLLNKKKNKEEHEERGQEEEGKLGDE